MTNTVFVAHTQKIPNDGRGLRVIEPYVAEYPSCLAPHTNRYSVEVPVTRDVIVRVVVDVTSSDAGQMNGVWGSWASQADRAAALAAAQVEAHHPETLACPW